MNHNTPVRRVTPSGLRALLKSEGWNIRGKPRESLELWQRERSEILIPLNYAAPDYPRRVDNFIEDFARENGLPEERIARELLYIEDDVVRLNIDNDRDVLPLADASKVINGARGMAIASACSTIRRSAHHGRSRPKKAVEYAQLIGMGHTIPGSFIIPIVSPVGSISPVVIDGDEDPIIDIETEQSFFPRRATGMMADVFKEINRVAVIPDRIPSKEELSRAVVGGLSADACMAVAEMVAAPGSGDLNVLFRWALASTPPRAGGERMSFPKESAGAIREVGHILRDEVKVADTVVYGFVSSLDREPDDEAGTVKVKALVAGRVRPVKLVLHGDTYHAAVEAHDLRLRVVITGSLIKSTNGRYSMSRVDLFRIDDYLPMEAAD